MTDDEIRDVLEAEFIGAEGKRNLTDDLRIAHAAIAAYQAKLRQGVELPESAGVGYVIRWESGDTPSTHRAGYASVVGAKVFTDHQLQQYGDSRDQAGYLRGLETALLKVTGLSVDVERCKQLQLTTQAWEEALDAAAATIEKLKGGE